MSANPRTAITVHFGLSPRHTLFAPVLLESPVLDGDHFGRVVARDAILYPGAET